MWALRSHTSPRSITAYASPSCAFPSRSALTSVPTNSIPHSNRSSSSNLCPALRLVATSPDAGLRPPRLAIVAPVPRHEVHTPAGSVHRIHSHGDRVAASQRAAATLPHQGGLRLVQVESLLSQHPDGQQSLVDVP